MICTPCFCTIFYSLYKTKFIIYKKEPLSLMFILRILSSFKFQILMKNFRYKLFPNVQRLMKNTIEAV